jgi:hypothetical protein
MKNCPEKPISADYFSLLVTFSVCCKGLAGGNMLLSQSGVAHAVVQIYSKISGLKK